MLLADLLTWANDWSVFLDILIPLLLAWAGWSAKKWVEGIASGMNVNLEARTAPIQPGANGGASLPDAIRGIDKLDTKLDRVHDRIDTLHEKVNELARDFEHLRGRFEQHVDTHGE